MAVTMAEKDNDRENKSYVIPSAHYAELLDSIAEIIAYDILKNMERNDKEDSDV